MTSSTKVNGQLTPELIKRIKDILEAQENGTTLYYTSHYYTEVLGFRFPRREISAELKNLGSNEYKAKDANPVAPEAVERITANASVDAPVTLYGLPVTALIERGQGTTDGHHRLTDLGYLDLTHLCRFGRFVFTEPVKTRRFYTATRVMVLRPDVEMNTVKMERLIKLWRKQHPGMVNLIEDVELEDFVAQVKQWLASSRVTEVPKPLSLLRSPVSTVESLRGTLEENPVILFAGHPTHKGLALNPELYHMAGGTGNTPVYRTGYVKERVDALLESIGRTRTYEFVWRKTLDIAPLYTNEQYSFVREWIREEGNLKEASDGWKDEARNVFPAEQPIILHALSREVIYAVKNSGEDKILPILRKHKSGIVKVTRWSPRTGVIAPLVAADLLYTKEQADAIAEGIAEIGSTR